MVFIAICIIIVFIIRLSRLRAAELCETGKNRPLVENIKTNDRRSSPGIVRVPGSLHANRIRRSDWHSSSSPVAIMDLSERLRLR